MADRRSLFSRFFPASAPRRAPPTQTSAPPLAITNSPPKDKREPVGQSSTTSTTTSAPPTAENPVPSRVSAVINGSSPPTPTTQPTTNHQTNDQQRKSPSSQVQTATQPTATSTNIVDEPKTTSPLHATTQSPSSSKPASPNRRVTQSRSPPQPSPTPRRAPQPRSPSHPTSRSPKQGTSSSSKRTQPTSPQKESIKPTEDIPSPHEAPILASRENNPKSAAFQQESQLKAEVKSDSGGDFKGQSLGGTVKHDKVQPTISQSSEAGPGKPEPTKSLDSSVISGEDEPLVALNAKPEEAKDVKEVLKETNTKASEERKEEVNDSLTSKSGSETQIIEKKASEDTKKEANDPLTSNSGSEQVIEKDEIPRKPNKAQSEDKEALPPKEILATSLSNATISHPKKRATIVGTHNKSTVPNGEHVPLHKNIRDNMSTLVNQIGDSERAIYESPVSVITLAGDNRGASMQMESNSSKREGSVHIHRSYKINPDESDGATTDGEGGSDQKRPGIASPTDDQPTEAYVNNNSQGVNNSIVFNSSVTEGNPGVHMIVTHLPKEQIQSMDKVNLAETRKAEFNMSRTENLTYQPTVKRRCLRGLFLETSDSDADNPEKPRRHGCRVGCQKRDEEKNVDVL